MRWPRRTPKRHRRDWRRLWRYCRCGFRWRCPDDVDLIPMPYPPPDPLPGQVREVTPDPAPPPPRARPMNRGTGWNAPTGSHLTSRAGRLTPAQAARSRSTAR